MTRSQSGCVARQLQEANRRIEELLQDKQRANITITNLRSGQQKYEKHVEKKQFRIDRLELVIRNLQGHKKRLAAECNEWREEARITDANYQYILDELLKPYAKRRTMNFKAQPGESFKKVVDTILFDLNQVLSLRREGQRLQSQVQELQQDLLAKVAKVDVISDNQFAKEFRSLAASIKSLSRSIPFTAGINVDAYLDYFVLLKDVRPYHWDGRARKKLLIEAWIWSILLCLVFSSPYAFFGAHCKGVETAWTQIFGAGYLDNWPKPSSQAEDWRVKTVEHLMSQTSRDIVTQGKSDYMLEGLTGSVIEARTFVAGIITGHMEMISSEHDILQIQLIVDKAFALALQMSLQRSRIQVTYPAVGATFHTEQMLSADEDDDEDMGQGTVAFIINPGLAKWGDAHGKNFDHRYDIVPSLVQLVQKDPGHICGANGQVSPGVAVET